jgi:hypothetical protein
MLACPQERQNYSKDFSKMKIFCFYAQVLQHYRNRGAPAAGRSPESQVIFPDFPGAFFSFPE